MKKLISIIMVILTVIILAGCDSQASRVSENLSKEADSFNVVRQLTVINCIKGDVVFQMTGKISIEVDKEKHQLEVVVEDENGLYQKHFVGLSDNVTYVLEQKNFKNVSKYKYTLRYNPNMWLPIEVRAID